MTQNSSAEAILELHQITKHFGSLTALDDVSLTVQRGRILALLGENGAGKTTLMRIAFGMIHPDKGWITVNGAKTHFASPADAIEAGIGMVHQQFSLIPEMTVAENVALGGKGRYSARDVAQALSRIAETTGLELDASARVRELSNADRQKLEIIRTIAHRAEVMILDEPTAVLTPKDIAELFRQLREFANNGGAVVLITHKLADALQHADDVVVLRRGKVVLSAEMKDVALETLAKAMIGSSIELDSASFPSHQINSPPVAVLDHVVVAIPRSAGHHEISIEIPAGRITGIAALDGAAFPLMRVLAGRMSPLSGVARLPRTIGFVPENRKDEALISAFSLTENFALAAVAAADKRLDWSSFTHETETVITDFQVRAPGPDASPAQLSGGNQQRFVLGRELRGMPELLVLENPTQGLDVNASAFIHTKMREARERGAGVVFYSSDLDELAQLSDKVLVITSRGVVSVAADRAAIGNALLGIA